MKLTFAFLAAIAESKRQHRLTKPTSDSDERSGMYGPYFVPDKECSADMITSTENVDGQSGSLSLDDHGNYEHCFVSFASQCSNGVDVEITHMSIESQMMHESDPYDYGYDYDVCWDSVYFAYKQDGEQKLTVEMCGCLENTDGCNFRRDSGQDMVMLPTVHPSNYWLNGDDAKMVFTSDQSHDNGSISVDWKCHEDPNVNWNICPSNTCYTQSEGWAPGKDVSCAMTNSDCLNVTCTSNSIKANFRADLFHTNLENEVSFMDQLESGHREMWYNGNKLELNAPCGFTLTADGVQIDWTYDHCNLTPTMNDNEDIVYSISLSSPGNAPGYETIEFYVDTAVTASCVYDSKVVVNADGFWVNQEDVEAAGDAMGKLDGTFDCKFFNDEARNNQILSDNIVNMGEMIYGQVTSTALNGLSYELVGVTVTNANNLAMSFPVIDGGVPNSDVRASSDGSAETGQSVNFSYLSFGFESETGTNQNEINIECAVDLFVSIEETTTTTTTTTDPPTTYSEWKTHDIEYNPCNHDPNANCVTQCDDNGNCYLINLNE